MNNYLDSMRLDDLKQEYGEAFYILDTSKFKSNYQELLYAFSSKYTNFQIAYSYKTNYTPKLCKIVNEFGGYAEVVSEMEFELAEKIGVDYKQIIWNGPIKSKQMLERSLVNGAIINIDSIEEFSIIKDIIKKYPQKSFRIGLRCNFDVGDEVISRFGFDIESVEFKETLEYITKNPNLIFTSLHCHFAKRNIEYWESRVRGMIEIIRRIGNVPEIIDLGGGLFGKMEKSLEQQFKHIIPTYEEYADVVTKIMINEFGFNGGPKLVIEPGTALVGDCMKFVGTIKSIKSIRGKYYATLLGSQKNINMSNINPPIEVVSSNNGQRAYENVDFVGFTCIEGDIIYRNYTGKLAVNDSVIISNCGSYSLVMKPPFILPNFPVIEIHKNSVEIIKKGEEFDDVFRTYKF